MSNHSDLDDADIYCDLPNFHFDEAFKRLEEEKLELQNKVEDLGAKLDEMKKQNEKLVTKVKSLGKNISCLYKTAQRELQRKEQIIADLRKERDDLLYRRGLKDDQTATNKRPSRKQLTPTKKVRNGSIKRFQYSKPKNYVGFREENASPVGEDCVINNSFIKNNSETVSSKSSHVTADVSICDTEAPTNDSASVEFCSQEELNRKTSSLFEDCKCEKAHTHAEKSTIFSEPENNNQVTTPIKDKFSVHMSSEDCGFGQRRKIRRVVKVKPSLLAATLPQEGGEERRGMKRCWRKPEVIEMDQVAKCSRLQSPFRLHNVTAGETPNQCHSLAKEREQESGSIVTEHQDDDFLSSETAMFGSKCSSSSSTSKVFQKGVDGLHLAYNGLTEKALNEKRDSILAYSKNEKPESENASKLSHVDSEISEKEIISQSTFHCELDSAFSSVITKTTDNMIIRTCANKEEHESFKLSKHSSKKEDNKAGERCKNLSSSTSSSSPHNSHENEDMRYITTEIVPSFDRVSKDEDCKHFRSWEKERVIACESLNDSPGSDRRERYSDGDNEIVHRGREKERRKDLDHTKGLDHGKNRDKNVSQHQGHDRTRMWNSSRGEGRDRGRHQNIWRDQVRKRDGEEEGRRGDVFGSVKRFSKECRDGDELDRRRTRGAIRGHKSNREVWSGYRDRDRPRRDSEERDRNAKWCKKTLYHKDRMDSRNPVHSAIRTADDLIRTNHSISPEWD